MSFASPGYLFLLLFLIPVVGWYIYELHKADASVQMSSATTLKRSTRSWRVYLLHVPFVLRVAAITLLSIALARPQLTNRWSSESTEGIDIMMALDISGTMQAEDLKPNRLEAAKQVASDFVIARPNDQIGLVVFAGESFTQCPLTTDHAVLVNLFKSVKFGMIEDGTAIGLGLANAVNRMKDSPTKSKVIILLTDGSNNAGDVAPRDAASVAKAMGVRLYTIGVGSKGEVDMQVGVDPFGRPITQKVKADIDEEVLQAMAQLTGGRYFRATNKSKLADIFDEIDQMEKTKMNIREFSRKEEEFLPFVLAALALLLMHVLIKNTILRNIP